MGLMHGHMDGTDARRMDDATAAEYVDAWDRLTSLKVGRRESKAQEKANQAIRLRELCRGHSAATFSTRDGRVASLTAAICPPPLSLRKSVVAAVEILDLHTTWMPFISSNCTPTLFPVHAPSDWVSMSDQKS